jgi:DNA-binding CsgD family transcriptional regulator
VLYGRLKERTLIADLLAEAREGHSGVLVICGEAGIGKHTLLQDAASQASDFQLLRAAGIESEVGLPFAALHQLLRPVLDRVDRLPLPQAAALRGAFGLVDTESAAASNQFLVGLGALGLLAELARERPVLCLVRDAQWLDQASADALVFMARRLEHDRIVLLLAARDDDVRQFRADGLPEVRLGGLDAAAAGELLEASAGRIAPQVRERLIEETGGNPLALLELPATVTSEQLAGRELLPERIPLSARLRQAFLQRVRLLPGATQTLLLVAAAVDAGELATILAAALLLGCGSDALGPAEQAGLVQVAGSELVFRHPLVRSAVYDAATFTARQAAHQALIAVLQGDQHADRRAWHLAAATLGSDEKVAGALEDLADRARRRGGPAAAAAALERAAALTPETAPRARRLLAAAEYGWEAGRPERAQALLDRAEPGLSDSTGRARLAHLRGAIELAAGSPATACTLLVEGAKLLPVRDPERATEMLVLATWAALAAGQLERIPDEILPAVPRRPGPDARIQRVADSLLALGRGQRPRVAAATVPPEADTAWPPPAFVFTWPMLVLTEPAGDDVAADQLYARAVAAHRVAGTVSTLTVALAHLALTEFLLSRWSDAAGTASEGLRLAEETGQHSLAAVFVTVLARTAAIQGGVDDGRRLAEQALAAAIPRRLAVVAAVASWTLAQLDLMEGRPSAALDRLLALASPKHPTAHAAIALLATRDLAEAAARAGRVEGTDALVARFERWARWDRRTWTVVSAHLSRALTTQGEDAERHYRSALAADRLGELPFDLAHTELAYGEWLRRSRRRADARPHLRTALELFEQLGAAPWAEQARDELRASGESTRRRDPSTRYQLTPRERQIARLASRGLANHEIGARLFLSTHTVSYHLHKVYAKLGITARGQLAELDLDNAG